MFYKKYIRSIPLEIDKMSRLPIDFFKFGTTLVLLALTGIYLLCEREVEVGGVGVELFYTPMLDYILSSFIIFWAGMFILDLTQKEITAGKKHRR